MDSSRAWRAKGIIKAITAKIIITFRMVFIV
jgi:hypothetical protein